MRQYIPVGYLINYCDVIMGAIASQITSFTIVYSIVYSDADQRKHQSSASMAFVRGIHRGQVNSPHKWPVTRKMFPFDDVIMFLVYALIWAMDSLDLGPVVVESFSMSQPVHENGLTIPLLMPNILRQINFLRAKFCRGSISIYLHFMSLLHIDMIQVFKILPQVRPGPTYST